MRCPPFEAARTRTSSFSRPRRTSVESGENEMQITVETPAPADKFITGPETYEITSLSRVTVKRWEDDGRFPKRITLSGSRVVWRLSEIQDWMKDPNGWPERNAAKHQKAA